jgi:trehalose 6-phosphate synthase/phosphatase
MSRLLLVSNRLPVTVRAEGEGGVRVVPSVGGLATGLSRPHQERGGVWLGWPGDVRRLQPAQRSQLEVELARLRCVPLYLSSHEVNRYYEGFSNGVLWPVFHSMPERVPMEERHFGTYRHVNDRFAEAVVEQWQPGDTIWVHDYQLLFVPGLIRARLPDARIGFFLHIPFPPVELFRTLPWRAKLLKGMLGADLIGFHTSEFMHHFEEAVAELTDLRQEGAEVVMPNGRVAHLGAFPMGIDFASFEAMATETGVREEAAAIRSRARAQGQRLILGVDRMDYTKGIPHRLVAVKRLLDRQPEWRGRIRFVQLTVPSRERVASYELLRKEVETLSGRINSQFGDVESVPVHYLYRGSGMKELVALYAAADVIMVTPLRDGMNLVAKEFVACHPELDGALVLSEFAGAAAQMSEALIVNPYDIDQVAEALRAALQMPDDERARRMEALRKGVRETDVHWWVAQFLGELERVGRENATRRSPTEAIEHLLAQMRAESHRVLLLDYDGTLVPLVPSPELAAPDAELLELLRQLAAMPDTAVEIVSGRPREVLEKWLGALPVGLHSEHGLWSRHAPEDQWHRLGDVPTAWMPRLRPVLEAFAARAPGAFVEEKSASLAWHYRKVPSEVAAPLAREVQEALATWCSREGYGDALEIMSGNKVIEVRPHGVHKGRIIGTVLNRIEGSPLVVAFGDDRTDEDLFAALPENALAVHVGPTPSRAPLRLASPEALRALLWALLTPVERPSAARQEPPTVSH